MGVYKVIITEINKGEVEVEAKSREDAVRLIETDYGEHANDYVLEPEDTTFEAEEV